MLLKTKITFAMALAVAGVVPATAQDAEGGDPGGFTVTIGVESALRINDNFNLNNTTHGTTTLLDNSYDIEANWLTPISSLTLGVGGVLRFSDIPGNPDSFHFDQPDFDLIYERESANANLTFNASYENNDLSFLDPLSTTDTPSTGDLTNSTGSIETKYTEILLETGTNSPLGLIFDFSHQETDYSDVVDPDLNDSETDFGAIVGILQVSPVAELRLTASREKFSSTRFGGFKRDTDNFDAELNYNLSEISTITANLGFVDEMQSSPTSMSSFDGIQGGIGWLTQRESSSFGLNLQSDLTSTGRRNTLTALFGLTGPTQQFELTAGVSDAENDTPKPVLRFEYDQEFRTGTLSAYLERSYATNSDLNDIEFTRARLAYVHLFAEDSSVTFDFEYADLQESLAAGPRDVTSQEIGITYARPLTRDWVMEIGAQRTTYQDSGIAGLPGSVTDASSNELFLSLSREFIYQP